MCKPDELMKLDNNLYNDRTEFYDIEFNIDIDKEEDFENMHVYANVQ